MSTRRVLLVVSKAALPGPGKQWGGSLTVLDHVMLYVT